MILRHDIQIGVTSEKAKCVDKKKLTNGVILPIDDFCYWMVKLVHFTKHFGTYKLRHIFEQCFPDCPLHKHVNRLDWEHAVVPQGYALKWLSVCSFDKPRFAKLCSTKYEVDADNVGQVVVDRVIGITAIQGHTVADSASQYRLLGF